MKRVLFGLALAALVSASWATPGNNGGGNGGCGVGQQTNGCGGQGGAGGAGGQGGAGGTGLGVGVGVGVGIAGAAANAQGGNAAVLGSGNSSNRNDNTNVNANQNNNLNVQGQQQRQGQEQGQSQNSRNTNTNRATGGNATGGNGFGGNATGGAGGSGGSSDNSNVIAVGGDVTNYSRPAASSAAPVYVNPPSADVCQRAGFGLSLQGYGGGGAISAGGSESDSCEIRANAVNLKFTGAPESVIRALQCQNPKIKQAYEDAGISCKSGSKVSSAPTAVPATAAVAVSQEPSDPFIRQRLGLPALR